MSDGTSHDVETFFVSGWYRVMLGVGMLVFGGVGVWHVWREGMLDRLQGLAGLAFEIMWGWSLWRSFFVPIMTISTSMITYRSPLLGKPKRIPLAELAGIGGATGDPLSAALLR